MKTILSKVCLEPSARELVYALCKFGGEDEFSFLFKLFLNYKDGIRFWNPFAVVNRISDMATKKHIALLEKVINTKEFWQYYKWEDRPEPKIPLSDYSNVYFIKRLAGTAFGKVATRAKFPIVYKMLCHDYWIIRNAALEAIRKHGNTNDIGTLLERAIGAPTKSEGLVEAICIIDDKTNKIKDVS
ncbi:unnamed protein product [marine sediment metagenome]|uniref:HEAT repeat domain-containing protein n=1 Tax=marine sediment metagenome TaxID=412755 RepID=X1EKB0_9ZZZZ